MLGLTILAAWHSLQQAVGTHNLTENICTKECTHMTSQRIGKYACLEVEARFLLTKVPDGLLNQRAVWKITDRYLPNTRLRLRHMHALAGDEVIYKLTQKFRSATQSAYETTITNLYLTQAEYQLFSALDARIIQKIRYLYSLQNHALSVDVFEGRHQGMILAEMELENTGQASELDLAALGLKDVTDDPFFTGGNLAFLADEEFKHGLSQRLVENEDLI